ncbi:hypothetical protein [Streptomyces sp. NPDC048560]
MPERVQQVWASVRGTDTIAVLALDAVGVGGLDRIGAVRGPVAV